MCALAPISAATLCVELIALLVVQMTNLVSRIARFCVCSVGCVLKVCVGARITWLQYCTEDAGSGDVVYGTARSL